MKLPDFETLANDIISFDNLKHKIDCEDYYQNFLMFMTTTLVYNLPDKTLNYPQMILQTIH